MKQVIVHLRAAASAFRTSPAVPWQDRALEGTACLVDALAAYLDRGLGWYGDKP